MNYFVNEVPKKKDDGGDYYNNKFEELYNDDPKLALTELDE